MWIHSFCFALMDGELICREAVEQMVFLNGGLRNREVVK